MSHLTSRLIKRVGPSRHRHRGGFTLLELMVAMTAGALVISSTYYLTSASTHYFREQQRIANMQSSVRYAMDQLRRDISRAGYGATPNNLFPDYAPVPPGGMGGQFTAISVTDLAGVNPSGDVHTIDGIPLAGDQLQLIGNYATSSDYPIRGIQAGGTTINFDNNWTTFTRDFTNWVNGGPYATITAAGNPFQTTFLAGRLVSVRHGHTGHRYFSQIAGSNAGAGTVTLATPITVPGIDASARVCPVSVMQYAVVPTVAGDTLAHNNVAAAGDNMLLIRREMNAPGSNVQVPNTFPRTLAERVVHFNVDFLVNQNAVRNQPPVLAPLTGAAAQGAPPHQIFSALVTLAVRTAIHDPRFPWILQNGNEELTRFRFDNRNAGSTRIRIARAEIFLPNVAYQWTSN